MQRKMWDPTRPSSSTAWTATATGRSGCGPSRVLDAGVGAATAAREPRRSRGSPHGPEAVVATVPGPDRGDGRAQVPSSRGTGGRHVASDDRYLVASGLRRYGHHDLALELTKRLRALVEARGISEHYDSRTGEPLGVPGLGDVVDRVERDRRERLRHPGRLPRHPRPGRGGGSALRLGRLEVAYRATAPSRSARASIARCTWPSAVARSGAKPRVTLRRPPAPLEAQGRRRQLLPRARARDLMPRLSSAD